MCSKEKRELTLISGKKRQMYSWETKISGVEGRDGATREVIMVDDLCPL